MKKSKRRKFSSQTRDKNFTVAGPVKIIKTDGSTEIKPALTPKEFRRVVKTRDVSNNKRHKVMARDKHCRYCGNISGPFHIDHVVPVSQGGSSALNNLVLSCVECNLRKGARVWRVRF